MDITVVEIQPTGEFGGQVFEYESSNDLFKCVNPGCGIYEIVARANAKEQGIGAITPCPAASGANTSPATVEPVAPGDTHRDRPSSSEAAIFGCRYGCDDDTGDGYGCDGACMGG